MSNNETYAYFTIDGLGESSTITNLLGIMPTREFSEGQSRERTGVYKSMKWMLYSRLEEKGALHSTLEQHIEDVLTQVEAIKEKLIMLDIKYEKYIQIVVCYYGPNLGCGISASLVERAAKLGLGFDFDLYSLENQTNA